MPQQLSAKALAVAATRAAPRRHSASPAPCGVAALILSGQPFDGRHAPQQNYTGAGSGCCQWRVYRAPSSGHTRARLSGSPPRASAAKSRSDTGVSGDPYVVGVDGDRPGGSTPASLPATYQSARFGLLSGTRSSSRRMKYDFFPPSSVYVTA